MADAGKWGDLGPRVGSAIVMLAIGAAAIWQGGITFRGLAVVLTGLMVWELSRMTSDKKAEAQLLGILAAGIMAAVLWSGQTSYALGFLVIPFLGLFLTRKEGATYFLYALALQFAVHEMVVVREGGGMSMLLWVVAVVIASDVMGYFAGRTLGGPKFWPAISPKKTWSGTVAGWIGAALVGLGFVYWAGAAGLLVVISVLTAFAGQMGDIAESAIKRRVGIKDSSNLIPGHGGLLDRFDALIGAALFLAALRLTLGVAW